jgi:catechol 2,3-dioxygenase-like lactoylglutathione lyase family enzyme
MRLMSFRLGSNDLAKTRAFYDATFAALGVPRYETPPEYPVVMYRLPDGVSFTAGPARDGEPATHANGGTIVFEADSEEAVRAWHAAGIANGGTCEGPPDPRPRVRDAFGAYMRDPDGNKLAAYYGLTMA